MSAFLKVIVVTATFLIASPSYAQGITKAFRLGTAALPYGWSTAIADFDADKKPDFAIANKIGTSPRGYEYSIELNLSLESPQVFRFHSADSALSIAALDLDNDHDLDVVLTRPFNGEVVGVWINNGSGQFSEGSREDVPPVVQSLSEDICRDANASLPFLGPPLRRLMHLPVSKFQISVDDLCKEHVIADQAYVSVDHSILVTSRAPPSLNV